MESLLKVLSCLMLMFLLTVQILLRTPYRENLTDDSLNGRGLKTYETTLYRGAISLDAFGNYVPNSCELLINGEYARTVDAFPVELSVKDGDVIEIHLKRDNPAFYVYLSSRAGQIKTDLAESTVQVQPGNKRILKVLADKEGK